MRGNPKARTPADNQTVRNVFVIGPDKKIKLILVYPMTTGRNFDEVLRVIDSLQLTARHRVSTPVNWKQGEDVIIAGSVSNDEAQADLRQLEGAQALNPHRAPAGLRRLRGEDNIGARAECAAASTPDTRPCVSHQPGRLATDMIRRW